MNYDEIREQAREEHFRHQDQQIAERDEWINMSFKSTQMDIDQWERLYKNRHSKHSFFIVVRAYIPFYDIKASWQCWVELWTEKGVHTVRGYEQSRKASAQFVQMIELSKDSKWTEEVTGGGWHRFKYPLNNPVIEKS